MAVPTLPTPTMDTLLVRCSNTPQSILLNARFGLVIRGLPRRIPLTAATVFLYPPVMPVLTLPKLSWWKRGLVAGASGTAAMAAWYHLERTLRKGHYTGVTTLADGTPVEGLWSHEGLDYDDSVVPGQIVAELVVEEIYQRCERRGRRR